MEFNKPKRPRIRTFATSIAHQDYGEQYQQNAASANAKYLGTFEETWLHEFWIDKHYTNRKTFGDENGPRIGIDTEVVEKLIRKSIPHLFYYSLKHNFSFVNFPPKARWTKRTILQEIFNNEEKLNVVVEFHFLELNKYEVTVITAMKVEDFNIQDNQYSLEFDGDESVLFLKRNGKNEEVDRYSM